MGDAGGKGGKAVQHAAKNKQRGQKVRVASDDGPSAVAHMAHGREPICYRCGKKGPTRQTLRKSSRSPSRKRAPTTPKVEEVSGAAVMQMMQDQMAQSERRHQEHQQQTQQFMQFVMQNFSPRTSAVAREDPYPGVFN